MAKQAEAERERRAKVINAEGEYQAATKLAQAAEIISARPEALQLRYLQTMREMAAESQTATILPIPLDFIRSFFHGPNHAAPARAGMEPAQAGPAPMPRTTVEPADGSEAAPDGDA